METSEIIKQNPLIEAKILLRKAMVENKRTPEDVKKDLNLEKYND